MSFNAREVDVLAAMLDRVNTGRGLVAFAEQHKVELGALLDKAAKMRETIEKVEQSNGAAEAKQ